MATKKSVARPRSTKAAPAKKPVGRRSVATAAKKPVAKKAVAKRPVAKKAVAKQPVPQRAVAKKPVARVAVSAAKPAQAKKPVAKVAPARAQKPAPAKPETKRAPAKPEPKPVAKPTRPEPKAVETPEPKPAKPKATYTVGDKVVHPQHGAAVIDRKVRQEFGGKMRDYYVLDIATDQLKVFVPVETIHMVIRPVISKNQTRHVFSIFREEPQEAGSNWSRWYKVLNEKMTSGEINQVAEVVRDLSYAQQTKGISPALKRMLSRARLTLTSEIRFALNIDEEEATRRLDRSLPKVEQPLPASS